MEETKVKKEIIVKRLSAFKFEVAVTDEKNQSARVSVIKRAPPATTSPSQPQSIIPKEDSAAPGTVLIRYAILHRIVEMLLWKLLGEQRLRQYCGYPTVTTCVLLERVVSLSSTSKSPSRESNGCNGTIKCFLENVGRFLKICAPSEELWRRFGWNKLNEEAILRKIYDEELSPSLKDDELQQDPNITHAFTDMQLLLQWERQGYTAVSWQGDRYISTLLPRITALEKTIYKNPAEKSSNWRMPGSNGFPSRVADRGYQRFPGRRHSSSMFVPTWGSRSFTPLHKLEESGMDHRAVGTFIGDSNMYVDRQSGMFYKVKHPRGNSHLLTINKI